MKGPLIEQPSAVPTRKVGAATAAAAFVTFLVSVLNRLAGAGITPEEAGALITIAGFVAGYLTKERDSPHSAGT